MNIFLGPNVLMFCQRGDGVTGSAIGIVLHPNIAALRLQEILW